MSAGGRHRFAARRQVAKCHHDDSGAALVEFALVVPLFMLLLFGIIQFGLAFGGWASLRSSVQNSARLIALDNPGQSPTTACTALTTAESDNPGYSPTPGQLTTSTQEMFCEIATQIGTPVGTSSTSVPEIGLGINAGGTGGNGTVTVCAKVAAQPFTGFFPTFHLSTSSQFYIEDPAPKSDRIQNYNPYGLAGCGS